MNYLRRAKMTRAEAFKELISQRAIHEKLGITSQQVRNFRRNSVNDKTMLELLLKSDEFEFVPEDFKKKVI